MCNVIVTIKGGCTSVLRKHLKIKHKIELPLLHPTKTVQSSSQIDIRNFVEAKDTIYNILTDLIAIDGPSFYTVANSKRLQEFALANGQKIPSSSFFIKSILLEHAKDI